MSQLFTSYLSFFCELLLICIIILIAGGQNLPQNPCYLFFKYRTSSSGYEGEVKIKFPINDIYVNLSVHAAQREPLKNVRINIF